MPDHPLVGGLDGVVGFFDVFVRDVSPHAGDLVLAAQLFEHGYDWPLFLFRSDFPGQYSCSPVLQMGTLWQIKNPSGVFVLFPPVFGYKNAAPLGTAVSISRR